VAGPTRPGRRLPARVNLTAARLQRLNRRQSHSPAREPCTALWASHACLNDVGCALAPLPQSPRAPPDPSPAAPAERRAHPTPNEGLCVIRSRAEGTYLGKVVTSGGSHEGTNGVTFCTRLPERAGRDQQAFLPRDDGALSAV
jgi:hypothetical protein